jgi:hypothetical protein
MSKVSSLSNFHRGIVRLLCCILGAAIGISLALVLVGALSCSFLLASLGGSTIFLFSLTRTPRPSHAHSSEAT